MGLAPPRPNPLEQPFHAWVVAVVESIDPLDATWGRPARVSLRIVETLRAATSPPVLPPPPQVPVPDGSIGAMREPVEPMLAAGTPPERVIVTFGAPRSSGQDYFYATRFLPGGPGGDTEETRRARARLDALSVRLPAVGESIIAGLSPPESADDVWRIVDLPDDSRWLEDTPAHRRGVMGLPPEVPTLLARLRRWFRR